MDIKPIIDELRDRVAEELDYGLEAEVAGDLRRGVRRRPRLRRARTSSQQREQVIVSRVDGRACRCRGSSPRAPRSSATPPAQLLPASSCSPGRRAPGCCTPTRTRATSGCTPDGRLRRPRLRRRQPAAPTACRRRSGRCSRSALEGDAEAVLAGLREEGFVKPSHRPRRRRAARLPRARSSSRCRAESSPSAGPGCAGSLAHINDPRRPHYAVGHASSTCRRRTC